MSSFTMSFGDGAVSGYEGMVSGVYHLRGAVEHAPRDVTFAFRPPWCWYAHDGVRPLWIENEDEFYWDFDESAGPLFTTRVGPGIVYRNPIPDLYALESLTATLRWLDAPAETSGPISGEFAGRRGLTYRNASAWGQRSEIVCDEETGAILRLEYEGLRGPKSLHCSMFHCTDTVDPNRFKWDGPRRPFDGPHVANLA
jgi:hypothetical protein